MHGFDVEVDDADAQDTLTLHVFAQDRQDALERALQQAENIRPAHAGCLVVSWVEPS